MESASDFVNADLNARLGMIKMIKYKLDRNTEDVGIDDTLMLELILGVDSPNSTLSLDALSVFEMVLEKRMYNKCWKALPFIMDFMGRCLDDKKLKIVEEGMSHPSWKTKVVTMKALSEEDIRHLGSPIKSLLQSPIYSTVGEQLPDQVCQNAKDLLKKIKLIGDKSKIPTESAELKKVEDVFEKYLSEGPECNVISESINEMESSIASGSVKEKIEALKTLRSHVGLTGFDTIVPVLRKALFDQNAEVTKQACVTTVFLLVKMNGRNIGSIVENFIQPLINSIGSLSDQVSLWAFVALKILIKNFCTSNVLVNVIFNVNSKSSRIRRKVGELLRSRLNDFPKSVQEGCTLLLEQSIKAGLSDEDPEIRAEWNKMFCETSKICDRAGRIYFDAMDKISTSNGASCKDQISEQDHVDVNGIQLNGIKNLSSGKFSTVISAHFLGRKVAIRKINTSDSKRFNREVDLFKMTENSGNFTPMLFELEFPGQKAIVMPYYENLIQALPNQIFLQDKSKIKVIHGLAKGLNYLHSFGIVHGSLEPKHVFISHSNESFQVKLRNFGRSALESEVPFYKPSKGWSDPEALKIPGNFSKGVDVFSLGLVAYFVWSNGQDHKENVISGSHVIGDLELADKNFQGKMAIIHMTKEITKRATIKQILMFPIFWKSDTYRYFVERLREMLRRSATIHEVIWGGLNWTKLVPDEFRADMILNKGLEDKCGHLVTFLRNLSLHGAETPERRNITGVKNDKLEGWIKKNFEGLLEIVFEDTYKSYDEQLISELQCICIQ